MRYDELTTRVVQAGLGVITSPEEADDDSGPAAPAPGPLAREHDVADGQDGLDGPSLPRAGPGGPEQDGMRRRSGPQS